MPTPARRRAERFAALLDGSAAPSGSGQLELLAVSRTLRRLPLNGDIDPEFRERLRGRLAAVAAVQPADQLGAATVDRAPHGRSRPGLASRRIVATGRVVLAVLAVSGVVVASSDATPGSPLYGIKRATESAQFALTPGDARRGRLELSFARTRLAEAQQVRDDPAALVGVLSSMDDATRHGSRLLTGAAVDNRDRPALDSIDTFVGSQRPRVAALLDGATDQRSRAGAAASLVLLDRLQARADDLRPALRCPVPGVSTRDDLGPLPGPCQGDSSGAPGSATTHGSRKGAGPGGAGATSASPGSVASTGPGTSGQPGATGGPGLPGALPQGGTPSAPGDMGSAVGGVLGGVLGTLGVSPPPLPPLPVPSVPVPSVPVPSLPPVPGQH